jgi:hypothetical protein
MTAHVETPPAVMEYFAALSTFYKPYPMFHPLATFLNAQLRVDIDVLQPDSRAHVLQPLWLESIEHYVLAERRAKRHVSGISNPPSRTLLYR